MPGASIYRSVSYVISNDPVLSSHYLVETLQVSGAIAWQFYYGFIVPIGKEEVKSYGQVVLRSGIVIDMVGEASS